MYKNVTRQYEDPRVLKLIRELIPQDVLADGTIVAILKWFKNFMNWTPNQIICSNCTINDKSSSGTRFMQTRVQTGNSWRVRKIEMHTCDNCGATQIFPRYNDVLKIAEMKTGRCGEWSILFGAILSSISMEARIVHDYLDHCWNEVLLDGKWSHVDSSLQYPDSFNNPHYYERNWKKQYAYVLAFSSDRIEDVTRTYTEQWDSVLLRRQRLEQVESVRYLTIEDLQNFYHRIKPSFIESN